MAKYEDSLPSMNKMKSDMLGYRIIGSLFGKGKQVKQINNQFNELMEVSNKYNEYFTDHGWAIYSLLSTTMMKEAVEVYEKDGLDEAEKIITKYYQENLELDIGRLNSVEEFRIRYALLKNAFDDHIARRYHSSVLLLLIIVDGVVNDYTRKKGFFTGGTDVSAWDCMVGAEGGLQKLRDIFNRSRKKTSTEEIRIPYRNGILHGRDLNYSTVLVSSKCIGLVFAVFDWIRKKNDEDIRKEKHHKESNPPSFTELASQMKRNRDDKKLINEWVRMDYIIGDHFPEFGGVEDYSDFPFIIPVIEFFKYWEAQNYGALAKVLDEEYRCESNVRLRPKLCREEFEGRKFSTFRLIDVEDRAIALKKVEAEVEWHNADNQITTELEFGVIFTDINGKTVIPGSGDGQWILKPWNLGHLYCI